MEFFIADAFAEKAFGGNGAGVALVEEFPPADFMRRVDAELHFSETAFVKRLDETGFHIRYFTPTEEVALCGHATVAAFSALRQAGYIPDGDFALRTAAGELRVSVTESCVFMDMAEPRVLGTFSPEEASELYAACGLGGRDRPEDMEPMIVSTGLADILLPVKDRETLNGLSPCMERVEELSKKHSILSFHVFCPGQAEVLAYCRDFAPVCGIPEEAATGTANGALTHYLARLGRVTPGRENIIVQGEAMGRPSVVRSLVTEQGLVRVGGGAVVLFRGELTDP